jgi:hypothetical protein
MVSISRRDFIKHSMIMGAGAMALPVVLKSTAVSAIDLENPDKLLLCPPYLGCPTRSSILLNFVSGEKAIECCIRFSENKEVAGRECQQSEDISMEPLTVRQIRLEHLKSDTEYRYQFFARFKGQSEFQMLMENPFRTQRTAPSAFSFALFSDAHIYPSQEALNRYRILNRVTSSILARGPDLSLMLGDNIQTFTSHGGPMIEERYGGILYAQLRHALGALPSSVPLFNTIGNWEGENGWHPEREHGWARQARVTWVPTPDPKTYPEGGSEFGDYYGFSWGDALFLVLNVSGYTLSDHALQSPIGRADDWTLGEVQKQWLHKRLSTSTAKWKFLFLHHPVGGNGGDDLNSRYGRGGGRAAHAGEQALIHEWMKTYGVQAFFYGHDHVFTDIPVDGIHYICVGSAGAPWKFTEEETGYKTYWTPSGYTWVDVHEKRVKISFIGTDIPGPEGRVLYSFEIS